MEARATTSTHTFSLHGWAIEPKRLSIRNPDGGEVRVRPRSMSVLVTLAAARGQVVGKRELMDSVWPRSEVTDGVLSQAMLELRTAFADDPKNPQFIETIRSVGFRLIPPVRLRGLEPVVVRHPAVKAKPVEENHLNAWKRWILPAAVVLVISAGIGYYVTRSSPMSGADLPFIMIAPFEDLSADGDQGYFARGIAEEIALQLASSDRLRLFSTQALGPYLAEGEKPIEVASRFGVDLILTGSVHRQGDRIRVVAELSDTKNGEQEWLSSYERPLDNVFMIQDEIADSVATVLFGRDVIPTRMARTTSLTAYDYYLRGREVIAVHSYDTNEQAIRLFREAMALDPDFAAAQASLAEALAYRGYVYQRGIEVLEQAIAEADQALARNENLAQAHYAKSAALSGLGRFDDSAEAAKRALRASPNHSEAAFGLGYLADVSGDLRTAVAYYRRALELDPAQPRTVGLARIEFLAGRTEEALELGRRGDRLAPGIPTLYLAHLFTLMERHVQRANLCEQVLQAPIQRARNLCGFGALVAGDLETAESLLQEDWRQDPRARFGPFTFAPSATHLAWIKAKSNRKEEALALLAESERLTKNQLDRNNNHWALPYNLAAIAAVRNDTEASLYWLETAYDRGLRDYRLLELDPVFRSLDSEPRFAALLRMIKRDFAGLRRELDW